MGALLNEKKMRMSITLYFLAGLKVTFVRLYQFVIFFQLFFYLWYPFHVTDTSMSLSFNLLFNSFKFFSIHLDLTALSSKVRYFKIMTLTSFVQFLFCFYI